MRNIFIIINFVLLAALAVYTFWTPDRGKTVYVLNNEIFAAFKGKQELEAKLKALKDRNQRRVDSLSSLLGPASSMDDVQRIREMQENLAIEQQEVGDQYTSDIWKRINTYLQEFGRKKGYKFILGAAGNGNIMYAEDAVNVTEEAIEYINAKYQEGD